MTGISTHVLDAALGRPAADVAVELRAADGRVLVSAQTGTDGRIAPVLADLPDVGVYRLVFATGAYFAATGQNGFFPEVVIAFTVSDTEAHHHVPLLLSPYSYSTYRGS